MIIALKKKSDLEPHEDEFEIRKRSNRYLYGVGHIPFLTFALIACYGLKTHDLVITLIFGILTGASTYIPLLAVKKYRSLCEQLGERMTISKLYRWIFLGEEKSKSIWNHI